MLAGSINWLSLSKAYHTAYKTTKHCKISHCQVSHDLPLWTGTGIGTGLRTHELVGWTGGLHMPTTPGPPGKRV